MGHFFLVAGFLISHLLLNSCFLGTLKKRAHQEKVGVYLWAAWFYLQLVYGGCLGSTPCQKDFREGCPVTSITWAGTLFLKGPGPALISPSYSS